MPIKARTCFTFPIGAQLSKVIKIGPLPVKLAFQGQYMPLSILTCSARSGTCNSRRPRHPEARSKVICSVTSLGQSMSLSKVFVSAFVVMVGITCNVQGYTVAYGSTFADSQEDTLAREVDDPTAILAQLTVIRSLHSKKLFRSSAKPMSLI